jgi:hypothetical protein
MYSVIILIEQDDPVVRLFWGLTNQFPCAGCSDRGHNMNHCPNRKNIFQDRAAT